MNIGIDLRMLGNSNGGIGRYSFEITRHILELDNSNKFFLFVNKKNANPKDIALLAGFPATTIIESNIRHYSLGEQTSFLRLLNKYNLDLVHFPNFNVPIFY